MIRGKTRENAIPADRLASVGITVASWSEEVRRGTLLGHVCLANEQIIGYCFGDSTSGEVVVLAVLPDFEGQGIGKKLLNLVVQDLLAAGFSRLFLGCAADPATRSHGFYRYLGWRSIGTYDRAGDEILELIPRGSAEDAKGKSSLLHREA